MYFFMEQLPIEREPVVDLSQEFATLDYSTAFADILRKHRQSASLKIVADLSGKSDRDYQFAAWNLKAFIESALGNQKRTAIIRGKQSQRSIEGNVLASGVKFEAIDK